MERITRFRAICMVLVFSLILGFFSVRIYSLQVVQGNSLTGNKTTYTSTVRVRAARGDLLDRNGNVLVSNRASYNLVFNNYVFSNSEDPNGSLLKLLQLCRAEGIEYIEHFPVTETRPYEYDFDKFPAVWKTYFQSYLSYRSIDSDITAPLLIQTLRKDYRIPEEWSDQDARLVIGIRFEMDLRKGNITTLPNYEFIIDASDQERSTILELNTQGLYVETSTVREIKTQYAAHVLGFVGLMDAAEWETYKHIKGYPMDAYVGKSGFELAFEEYLHGTDGYKEVIVDTKGNILSEKYTQEPKAGNNVETTLDLPLQIAAEDALAARIEELRSQKEGSDGQDAEGAAVVVMDVKTGDILVCASYPTYNLATLQEDFEYLKTAPFQPMYNRALQGTYAPGSVYKMAMTIAAINNGVISSETKIRDKGVFNKYKDFKVQCLVYSRHGTTHGSITAAEALEVSCNYFFFVLGDKMNIWDIDYVAKMMGLGEKSGAELAEQPGRRANPDTKAQLFTDINLSGWYPADSVTAAIGHSINTFTPMQLCVYTSTLANQGVRYKGTFLNRIVSDDYRSLIRENVPIPLSTLSITSDAIKAYTEGMKLVAKSGTAKSLFKNYPIQICAKTGTAEHSGEGSDHGAFVCYAPADDPQIAIAVYGEKCGGGGKLAAVAKSILDVYFSVDNVGDVESNENEIS